MAELTRRNFLHGRFVARGAELRPPWALTGPAFHSACTRCGDCVRACPEGILETGSGNYPRVNFALGACTFCQQCVDSCKSGALLRRSKDAEPWTIAARIEANCLALNRTVCRTCGEVCDARAIVFRFVAGNGALPVVVNERCTGCGGCVAVCPVQAIRMVATNSVKLGVVA